MIQNKRRIGNFTSSEIFNLTTNGKAAGSFGKPFYTYIEECRMERNLGRSLEKEENAKGLSWGKLVEVRPFDLLGTEYKLSSEETFLHPEFDYWAGSPDGNKFDEGKTVFDIKCPISLKSFCQYVNALYEGFTGLAAMADILKNHPQGEKNYWQLVSNAILTNSKYAELIIYTPFKSELPIIRELAQNYNGDANKVAWVNWASDEELPYLIDGGFYKNLNIIRFEVPEKDMDFLTGRVKKAGGLLTKQSEFITA